MWTTTSFLVLSMKIFSIIIMAVPMGSRAIDCFRCSSFGHSSPWCEDPFHNNYSSTILQSPCWAGRKGRDGVYPASACIKLSGSFADSGETMVVRDCALDSGSLTTDTELVRMSHCGGFYYDNRYVKGCVQSCSENACNGQQQSSIANNRFLLSLLLFSKIIILPKIFSIPG